MQNCHMPDKNHRVIASPIHNIVLVHNLEQHVPSDDR